MTPEERGKEVERLKKAGKKGGISTRRKLGKAHYKRIGALGGKSRWKKV